MAEIALDEMGGFSVDSLDEVLTAMLSLPDASISEPGRGSGPVPASQLTAFVGFAGQCTGGVSIHGSGALGRALAARMLCADDPSELSADDITDAFGEVANMVAGGMKTRLEAGGATFEISVPVVLFAPTEVRLQYRLVSQLVMVETKCDGELLQLCFSIAITS